MTKTQRRAAARPRTAHAIAVCSALALALAAAGCGSDDDEAANASPSTANTGSDLPQGSDHVEIDPAEFTTEIDNPYWPMTPGESLGL